MGIEKMKNEASRKEFARIFREKAAVLKHKANVLNTHAAKLRTYAEFIELNLEERESKS